MIYKTLISLAALCLPALEAYAADAGVTAPPPGPDCRNERYRPEPLLRVLSLNAAHGRSDGPNQMLLDKSAFTANLARISRVLRDSRADIVGLQEVDGPSRWSGRFDHAEAMAEQADYPWHFRADHADSWLASYGTAVLSRLPFLGTRSHRFSASPPTPRKGFVIGQVQTPATTSSAPQMTVDVVSVHFDFFSRRTQASQLEELLVALAERDNPLIVLGDFNNEWHTPDSTVQALTEQAGLSVYQPEALHLATHGGERLDWILISPELQFLSYRVLPDVVSDHQPVLAEIGIRPKHARSAACGVADSGGYARPVIPAI